MTTAYDIAKSTGRFAFGIDQDSVAKELRNLADKIETRNDSMQLTTEAALQEPGQVLIQSAIFVTKATREDFTETTMILKFVERLLR